MRQWRVGSFSMGLILVLLGVGLIVDHYSAAHKALELVITWWPLALILLGIEILAVGFLSRNEQFKIKYDGWSIFLMIILFFFCLGSYALSLQRCASPDPEALAFLRLPLSHPGPGDQPGRNQQSDHLLPGRRPGAAQHPGR